MVTELRDLMREVTDHPPHDDGDLAPLLAAGRRRVRVRRARMLGATAVATAATVAATSFVLRDPSPVSLEAAGVPRAEGPVLRLADAAPAVEGRDYRVLASYTNENLDRDNGEYLDGVTDDGLVLFREGATMTRRQERYALMDPATGEKDWLPGLRGEQSQLFPARLGSDRLVLLTEAGMDDSADSADYAVFLAAQVLDRTTGEWSRITWPTLPAVDGPWSATVGPDGRLYVRVPATKGEPPEGGWPTGPDGEADDADAEGDTFELWSVSLDDPADVRDEGLRVGAVAFTDRAMVWTDGSNGDPGLVHVRDLASGEDTSFDPRTGERCNLLGFDAADDRIVMSQYCGTYDDGVRDDRVQVLSTDGDLVTTIQGSGIEGGLAGPDNRLLTVTSSEPARLGTYVYDLGSDRFLRLSDDLGRFWMPATAPEGRFFWSTPVNRDAGATQWLGELLP